MQSSANGLSPRKAFDIQSLSLALKMKNLKKKSDIDIDANFY